MAEALNDVNIQSAVTCDTCEHLAAHLCKTCHDKLCIRCKEIHTKSKSSFDHEITQLTFEALSLLGDIPSVQHCRSHPGCRINVCCKECQIPVCEKCLIGDHNGHKLTSTEELFHQKKKKLDEKYYFVESELPKYKAEFENFEKRNEKNDESRSTMENEIISHFAEAREKLDVEENRLLQIAKLKHQQEHCRLQTQKARVSEHINKTQAFMQMFHKEKSSERNEFILYANTSIGSTISGNIPCFPLPVTLQFTKGKLDEKFFNEISGTITANAPGVHLMQEMIELEIIQVGTGEVETLTYGPNDDTYWVFLSGDSSFKKFNRSGEVLFEVTTRSNKALNKPLCILPDGTIIFRQSRSCLAQVQDDKNETEFLKAKNDGSPICIYMSDGNTTVAIGIMNSSVTEGVILKFNTHTQCMSELKNKLFFRNTISNSGSTRIAENINGDIYMSNTDVDCFDKNGNFCFTYHGSDKAKYPFKPKGICADIMGNILIADRGNRLIHVLDMNGKLQRLYIVASEKEGFYPVTLAIDVNHCLCVGCSDGKIRVFKYLE